ncbi:G/U mismatch-specific DNA glycosylase [Nocardiopsis flavescens]|uniref:TDG/mug DNA glycosylase family protein n=1 Tax=Nocardiopsis flavescens TaxID=758803 RepID=A0A1M6V9R8_9ACTN|nr:G/U mismatch-specific DNA glycosylase [Nocardiopsis flavescens]SHK78104.1 TDG/mug DNA glycosylase family protein [Nocardiopsis flavescens]
MSGDAGRERAGRARPLRGVGGLSRAELDAARDRLLPDVLAEGMRVVFCGVNPGLTTAVRGHHFAGPGNRFWPALARAGFTPEVLPPEREGELPGWGLGLTNLVARPSRGIEELTPQEYVRGARVLAEKMRTWKPEWLGVLGVTAYRAAFGARTARVGPQEEMVGGARVWLLPNPSGRNAHWTPQALAGEYARLREAAGLPDLSPGP